MRGIINVSYGEVFFSLIKLFSEIMYGDIDLIHIIIYDPYNQFQLSLFQSLDQWKSS